MASLAADGTNQRIPVRCKGERAIDDPADTRLGVDRKVLEADSQRRGDAFQIGGEELCPEVPRGLLHRPRHTGLLVGTQKQAAALSTGVDLTAEVDSPDTVAVGGVQPGSNFRELLGNQVHVLHSQDGQFQAAHTAYLTGP